MARVRDPPRSDDERSGAEPRDTGLDAEPAGAAPDRLDELRLLVGHEPRIECATDARCGAAVDGDADVRYSRPREAQEQPRWRVSRRAHRADPEQRESERLP